MSGSKHILIAQTFGALAALYCAVTIMGQQQGQKWKEYVFADDDFAITVPSEPIPHPSGVPKGIDYSVSISREVRLSIYTSRDKVSDCGERIQELKQSSLSMLGDRLDSSSLKDVIFHNSPGLEYEWKVSPNRQGYALHFCMDSRLFSFSAEWPSGEQRPPAVRRIIKSFRPLSR